jgi:hypothetical protein
MLCKVSKRPTATLGMLGQGSNELFNASVSEFTWSRKDNCITLLIHLAVCLTTGPKPLPKRAVHIVQSRASSFRCEYPPLSLRSSSSFLRHLPRLPFTSIPPFIFPSITCRRRHFLRKMWPVLSSITKYIYELYILSNHNTFFLIKNCYIRFVHIKIQFWPSTIRIHQISLFCSPQRVSDVTAISSDYKPRNV